MDLAQQLEKLKEEALLEAKEISTLDGCEEFRNKYFSRKHGLLTLAMKGLKDASAEDRPKIGQIANEVKERVEAILQKTEQACKAEGKSADLDVTITKEVYSVGHIHPLTQIEWELEDIFTSMGFIVAEGPEVESDYFNFEALNIPAWHPARDTQDTFYIESKDKLVLRTHTSPVQVRAMREHGAPLRVVVPGRVYRNEDVDASHDHTFNQFEGLMIDKDISIGDLVGVMEELLSGVFKKDVTVRLRPGYFPFVEPGFELDLQCLLCNGEGCPVCKHEGWVEFMGAGLVHPNVLKHGGIDPKKYSGFAFGGGITRLVMMKYQIDDIRLLMSGDTRFINQF